jgi:hypothetical protein
MVDVLILANVWSFIRKTMSAGVQHVRTVGRSSEAEAWSRIENGARSTMFTQERRGKHVTTSQLYVWNQLEASNR